MNLGVAVAEEVDGDLAKDVEVDADMSRTQATTREISEAMMDFLEVMAGVMRKVNRGNRLKDVAVVGLVVLSVVVAEVVSAMEKPVKENGLEGFLIVTVALEEGQSSSGELLLTSMKPHHFPFL